MEDLGTNGHEIGIYNGHKAYLCHVDAAIDAYVQSVQGGKRPANEVSNEFTEHFGEKVLSSSRREPSFLMVATL